MSYNTYGRRELAKNRSEQLRTTDVDEAGRRGDGVWEGGDGDIEGMQGWVTGGLDLVFSLQLGGLMEALSSKLCQFIRGLPSDNFELSDWKQKTTHAHPDTYTHC